MCAPRLLAPAAQRALERVASGETDTIEGWLAYGAALNEGAGAVYRAQADAHLLRA